MRRRLKYHLPRSRGGVPSVVYWVLILALLAGFGWVWWSLDRGRRSGPKQAALPEPSAPAGVKSPAATAPVHTVTNPPPVVPAAAFKPAPTNLPPPAPTNRPPVTTNPSPVQGAAARPSGAVLLPAPATNLAGTTVVARAAEPTLPPPAARTNEFPRPATNWFEVQLLLDRLGISPGSIDGFAGAQSRAALRAFQTRAGLAPSGDWDEATRSNLVLTASPWVAYRVTDRDLARLQPVSHTWVGKARQTALDFETILELVSEKAHSHPRFIRSLNPNVDWKEVSAGTELILPDAALPAVTRKAAQVVIQLEARVLEAWDAEGRLLAHFPCSIAQHADKRPVGDLRVTVLIPHPTYTFNPEIFPESEEARHIRNKLILPAGPNNPVGVVWIGLSKSGYGIHGTPSPEQVGRTESHGCFRLANWNVRYLLDLAWVGMPVRVAK